MSYVIGHKKVIDAWTASKPETCLLLGPASVGKRTAALYMAEKVYECSTAVQNAVSEPLAGNVSYVVPGDDYEAVHRLLQIRGMAPVFIYTDEISQLAHEVDAVYRFGTLTYQEVIDVLTYRRLVPPPSMAGAARHSAGQIARAVSYYKTDSSRQIVQNILKATRMGNLDLLSQSLLGLRTFYPIVVWWTEATTGQWNHYSEDGSYDCHTSTALMEDIRHAAQISELGCPIQIAGRLAFWKTCERQASR